MRAKGRASDTSRRPVTSAATIGWHFGAQSALQSRRIGKSDTVATSIPRGEKPSIRVPFEFRRRNRFDGDSGTPA